MERRKFFLVLLVVLLAIVLQLKLKSGTSPTTDFVLAALLAVSPLLNLKALLFFILGSAWVLNWEPLIGWELFVFVLIPLAVWFGSRFVPWQGWLVNIIGVASGIFLFYLLTDYSLISTDIRILLHDIGWSVLFGSVIFHLFQKLYPSTRKTR